MSQGQPDGGTPLPLAKIRVLELSSYAAGPYAGYLLGTLGAEVVKVEPRTGDPMRGWGGSSDGPVSFFFRLCNSGKASVAVDLKQPRGAEAIQALLPRFDVVVTNLPEDLLEKAGLTGPKCLALNERLVYVGMTGLGSAGPIAGRPTFDTIAQSLAGLMSLFMENGPVPSSLPAMADMAGGVGGAAGALVGLASRGITGRGMIVETSLLESMTAVLASGHVHASFVESAGRSRSASSLMFQLAAADGRVIAVHVSTSEKFWRKLAEALGRPELITDERFSTYQQRVSNFDELCAVLGQVFATRSGAEWETALQRANLPFAPVYSMKEAPQQPQVQALELYAYDDEGRSVLFRGPWRFDGERPPARDWVPRLGADTAAVLGEVLTAEEIARLQADGIVTEAAS
jgi:crotonobetainyl-CoA:carnitine CoA-transferase CaiB-like acyl-CoA transferase